MLSIQKHLKNSFYALLALPATAMGLGLSVQIAALSWLLTYKYDLAIGDIGLVWATGPIAGIIGQVAIGIVSDNVWVMNGRRRVFILVGGVLASLMLLALPNIGIIQASLGVDGILGIAILVSMVLDLSINVSFNPTRAVIADVTPPGRARTKGYTWMQTVSGSFGVLSYGIGAVFGNIPLLYIGAGLVFVFSVIPPFFIEEPRSLGDSPGDGDSAVDGDSLGDGDSAVDGNFGEGGESLDDEDSVKGIKGTQSTSSLSQVLPGIRPLWGFLGYGIYAIIRRLTGFDAPGYYVEILALLTTVYLVAEALMKTEEGHSRDMAGQIGFRKVLAAHSFSWIGVQSMFIYMFSFVDFRIADLSSDDIGTVVNWSFFSLNLVAALIPVALLEPLSARFGRVHTHAWSLVVMTIGYGLIFLIGDSPWMLYLFMAVVGIGWASIISLPFAIMSQKISQDQMGMYMGLFNLSVVLPQLVSSFAIGDLMGNVENKSVLMLVCLTSVLISAVLWFAVKEDRYDVRA